MGLEVVWQLKEHLSVLSVLLCFVVFALLLLVYKTSKKGSNTIPSTGILFFLKNFNNLSAPIQKIVNEKKLTVLSIHFGFGRVVSATHPDTAQAFFAEELVGISKYSTKFPDEIGKLGQQSLALQNGDRWRHQRSSFSPAFHFDYLAKLSPVFYQKGLVLFEQWDKIPNLEQTPLEIKEWLAKFTVDVLGATVFGQEFNAMTGGTNEYLKSYNYIWSRIFFMPLLNVIPGYWKFKFLYRKYIEAVNNISNMTREIVQKKLADRQKNDTSNRQVDLLDMMLSNSAGLSMDEILDNIWMFFIAGHETTATALSWALYYFAKYPEFQRTAREEVDSVIGKAVPTHENVKQLTFLDYFIKEVLRIRTPASIILQRKTTKEIYLGDYTIPKGTLVGVNIEAIHRLEEFWTEPHKFDPYRFTPENSKNRHSYAYLPFSLGRRHCIGNNFSLLEQKIFLVSFLQKYTSHFVSEPTTGKLVMNNFPMTLPILVKYRK